MGNFIDVEGELSLNVLVFAFTIIDGLAVFGGERRELDGDGEIGGVGVADGVADVMGESADGEGELVSIAGVAKEVDDEISGADVVSEVREEWVAEGIVADVLNDAAAVGIGTGVFDFRRGERGVAREKKRDDGALPGEVNELLMGEQGLGARRSCGKQNKDCENREES